MSNLPQQPANKL